MIPNELINAVNAELQAAKIKHPQFSDTMYEGAAVITEELGEFVREINLYFEGKTPYMGNIHVELLQLMGTCVRFYEEFLGKNKNITNLLREPAEMPDCEGSIIKLNAIRPDYYKLPNGKDTIDVIAEVFGKDAAVNFCLGNALKYITRAGKKEGNRFEQDLNKATEYLNRAIKLRFKHGN
jgi:hypothetical protein